jgi:hypothetical protein
VSGVIDSGRESGHGNIDANDPERHPGRIRPVMPVNALAL